MLALANCQHEESTAEQSKNSIQTVSINEAKSFLTTSQNNSSGKSSGSQLESLNLEKITHEKLSNTDQLLTVIPVKRTNTVQFERVLLLKVNNEIKSVVYKMYSDDPQIKSPFSGKILIYDLGGNFINGFHLENGKATLQYIKKSSKSITNKTSSDEGSGIDLEEVPIFKKYKYKRFIPEMADFGWGDNLSGGGGGGEITWEQDPGAGDGGGVGAQSEAQVIEDIILDNDLDPCPKAVLAQLKNATNCDIANILTKLGSSSIYKVTISSGDSGFVPAITSKTDTNDYKITLSKDRFTSATELFKASILLHELGHAFFMSLVDDFDASKNPAVFGEFPVLFQYFVETKYPGKKQDAHHEEMANIYVEAIGAALQEFQTGVPVSYGVQPAQTYTDLAWGGLKNTPVFDKKFPNGTTERLRIENRLASEQTGNPVGSGTPLEQKPVGKPCK